MDDALRQVVQQALGTEVTRAERVSGGDINDAHQLQCRDGRRLFLKTHARPPKGAYASEAHGLGWLAEAGALRTPQVIAVRDEEPAFLVLEWIERGAPTPAAEEQLGRGLAALHQTSAPSFGLDRDNLIATLPQPNPSHPSWPDFYGAARVHPLATRAHERGLLGAQLLGSVERLLLRLPELCGPPEPPARLHGDLWGGNAMFDTRAEPVLIDPAVYAGHREVDLAMMRLFGGFSERCFAAYAEAWPLAPGHEERVPLYQLYPLLVHLNLFGAGYLGGFERALQRYV